MSHNTYHQQIINAQIAALRLKRSQKGKLDTYSRRCRGSKRASEQHHCFATLLWNFRRYLDSRNGMLTREVNRPLRMLKIVTFERISRPVAQTTKVKLCTRVL